MGGNALRRRDFLLCAGAGAALATAARPDTRSGFGQILLTGFRGTRAGDPEVDIVRRYLFDGAVAGVLLLKRNITSPEQLAALTHALRAATPGPAPIIAIDQEGGRVARLDAGNGFPPWMSAAAIAASGIT